ncbi:MAG TPA: beta-N-acetylhexosaminidase [Thermoanaerobaculia bacterium]|nr:beta-N-acetylhexosaminidase [Thermoanaerobaculia bacterium]
MRRIASRRRPSEPESHLVLTGIPDLQLDAAVRRRLERLQPGGIVLFRRNVGPPDELAALIRGLRGVLGPKCLIAIDQEGGRVARLGAPFTEWPPMRRLGETRNAGLARAAGRAIGRELSSVGINCDFAPVLDVDSNPENPVIGDRSFGRDPALVARLGCAFSRGLAEAGLIPCGKHFPGHGDTALDSHLALPRVDRSRRELMRCEIAPFRRAVRSGVPMLMSAHVLYPALDAELPATLSRAIMTELLRGQLGFRGVLVSDDLAMQALAGHGTVGELAVSALAAGCDLLLACQSLEAGEEAVAALKSALRRGRLDPARAREALARVRRLRRSIRTRRTKTALALPDPEAVRARRRLEQALERSRSRA